MSKSKTNFLFLTSGSIAAYKGATLVSALIQQGHQVQVVASQNSLAFVGAATWEGLTGRPVISDTFQTGEQMAHIHLRQWADHCIVYPATANLINSLAQGLANDMLTTTLLAWDFKKPLWLAPAMNSFMYEHPATQNSMRQLKHYGYRLLPVNSGQLACGEVGLGRIIEPSEVLTLLTSITPSKSLNVLVTGGGTEEPIDGVRSISNFSSGRTGVALCEAFLRAGHKVTFLHGQHSRQASQQADHISFASYADLLAQLKRLQSEKIFDVILHAAAVSDYSVSHGRVLGKVVHFNKNQKFPSNAEHLELHLTRNPKILPLLAGMNHPHKTCVIGFKLTQNASPEEQTEAVSNVFAGGGVDYVVHNDLSQIDAEQNIHVATIFSGPFSSTSAHDRESPLKDKSVPPPANLKARSASPHLALSKLANCQTRDQLARALVLLAEKHFQTGTEVDIEMLKSTLTSEKPCFETGDKEQGTNYRAEPPQGPIQSHTIQKETSP